MSYDCDLIRLSDEAKASGLFLYFTFLGLQKEVVGDLLTEAIAKALSVIRASAALRALRRTLSLGPTGTSTGGSG